MKVYFIFDIKSQFVGLYKNNQYDLFNILKHIYYLEENEIMYAYTLFKQLTNTIPKNSLDQEIYIKVHKDVPYLKKGDIHFYNNLYKNEVSRLIVKNAYIKIEAEQGYSTFFDILPSFSNSYFMCDFTNSEYCFL